MALTDLAIQNIVILTLQNAAHAVVRVEGDESKATWTPCIAVLLQNHLVHLWKEEGGVGGVKGQKCGWVLWLRSGLEASQF